MKEQKRIHIIILALFHLLVFVIPVSVKSEHHHSQPDKMKYSLDEKVISKTDASCPICKFEFVHFIATPLKQQAVFQIVKPVKNSEFVSAEYHKSFTYFSHRAPPSPEQS